MLRHGLVKAFVVSGCIVSLDTGFRIAEKPLQSASVSGFVGFLPVDPTVETENK